MIFYALTSLIIAAWPVGASCQKSPKKQTLTPPKARAIFFFLIFVEPWALCAYVRHHIVFQRAQGFSSCRFDLIDEQESNGVTFCCHRRRLLAASLFLAADQDAAPIFEANVSPAVNSFPLDVAGHGI